MTRSYKRLYAPATYWNIRVPKKFKESARKLADHFSTSPAEIARRGIEKELDHLEKIREEFKTNERN